MSHPQQYEWSGQLQHESRVAGRRLTVVITRFHKSSTDQLRWAGLAVEAPATAESLGDILSNHAHVDLGDHDTIGECIAAAEAFIARWEGDLTGELARCACGDIEPKTAAV